MTDRDQRRVEAFLTQAIGPSGRVLETHISKVFLGPNRVYKLKKAVTFPYLDYGTLALRRKACRDEFDLNRVFAPGIYKGVLAITENHDGQPSWDGAGAVLDHVVDMARFADDDRLDQVLEQGRLSRQHVIGLADLIRTIHQDAAIRRDRGGYQGMRFVADSNRDWLAGIAKEPIKHGQAITLLDRQVAALDRARTLLDGRREQGFVRRCHGDMHLENIVLWEGRATPFDAIEFNDWIGCVDILYDLAFPVMDLIWRGYPEYASVLWNRYLDHDGLSDGAAVMPLFLSFRAMVRALVAGTAHQAEKANSYLALADSALGTHQPGLVAIGGLSGSGKSRMGRVLSPHLGSLPGARQVRTDVVRKRLWGQGFAGRLPETAYSAEMNAKTYGEFYAECRRAIQAGFWVIADGVFARPEERQKIRSLADALGCPFIGLWLDAPLALREQRVLDRRFDVSDATAAVLDKQMNYDLGDIGWAVIDTGQPKADTLDQALSLIPKDIR